MQFVLQRKKKCQALIHFVPRNLAQVELFSPDPRAIFILHQNIRVQQMVEAISSICVNAIRSVPVADGLVPASRQNPIFISCSASSRRMSREIKGHNDGYQKCSFETLGHSLSSEKAGNIIQSPSFFRTEETLTLVGGLAFVSINLELHPAPFMHSCDKHSEHV